jgi:ribosomal protein S16
MAEARVDRARLDYWLSVGAKPSESLGKILREHKKALDAVAVGA